LIIAFAAGLIATFVAVIVGVASAYLGGVTDGILSTLTDILLVIPIFPLFIVIAAYLHSAGLLDIIIILGALNWSYSARQLRVQALSMRNRDFLKAASVRGERSSYIIAAEMLPSMSSLIVAAFCLNAVFAVLTAAGLQFIGLGDPNAQSWARCCTGRIKRRRCSRGSPCGRLCRGLPRALWGVPRPHQLRFDEISNPALRPVRRSSRPRHLKSNLGAPVDQELSAARDETTPAVTDEPTVNGQSDSEDASSNLLLSVRNLSVAYMTDGGRSWPLTMSISTCVAVSSWRSSVSPGAVSRRSCSPSVDSSLRQLKFSVGASLSAVKRWPR